VGRFKWGVPQSFTLLFPLQTRVYAGFPFGPVHVEASRRCETATDPESSLGSLWPKVAECYNMLTEYLCFTP